MNVLVLNAGSATLKFQLVDTGDAHIAADSDVKLARGQIERHRCEAVITSARVSMAWRARTPPELRDKRRRGGLGGGARDVGQEWQRPHEPRRHPRWWGIASCTVASSSPAARS
jgi:hypothetical protein